ncbi:MAG: hypothetical protein WDO24_04415 [Pseudomonadota bacterium]
MVDVLRSLDIEYIATNPASSFRGVHEAIVNYAHNKNPELLTCTHEEVAGRDGARLCQDRRQADGRAGPWHGRSAACRDGALQPPGATVRRVYMMIGNIVDGPMRAPWVEWGARGAGSGADRARLPQVG